MPRHPAPEPADLRARILDTAAALLEEAGPAALSMREVARRAGVTHQAPYHHFGDRESILAELVQQGFDELARRLARANDRAAADGARTHAVEAGMAYVGFALERPGLFRIMFRPDICDPARFPGARDAGGRAHGELLRMVALLHGGTPDEAMASGYWAQVHGLACLIVDGPLGQLLPGLRERKAHARQVLELMADGRLAAGA